METCRYPRLAFVLFLIFVMCRCSYSASLITRGEDDLKEVTVKQVGNDSLEEVPNNGSSEPNISTEMSRPVVATSTKTINYTSTTSRPSKSTTDRHLTRPHILWKKLLVNKVHLANNINNTNDRRPQTETSINNTRMVSTALPDHPNNGSLKKSKGDSMLDVIKGLSRKRNIENARNVVTPSLNSSLDNSIIASLMIGLVTVVLIMVLFVMIICFMHRWRENMIQSASHPSVLYSMLRQNETDPEDQLGEILVSIGLASESDIRPPSPSLASTPSSGDTTPRAFSPEIPPIGGPMLQPEPVAPPTPRMGDQACSHPLLLSEEEQGYPAQGWGFDILSNVPLHEDGEPALDSDEELLQ